MTDEKVLKEIRRWRKLSTSAFPRVACQAQRRVEELMEEYQVTEEELKQG